MARERWPKALRSSGANQRALRSVSGLFLFSVMVTPRDTSVPIPKFVCLRGPSFTNYGIERTLANLLIWCGFGSEARMMDSRRAMMRTSEPPHWTKVMSQAIHGEQGPRRSPGEIYGSPLTRTARIERPTDRRNFRSIDPAEFEVSPLRDEDHEDEQNREVGQRDQCVGNHMQPYELRFPQQADPVRREHRRIQDSFQVCPHIQHR